VVFSFLLQRAKWVGLSSTKNKFFEKLFLHIHLFNKCIPKVLHDMKCSITMDSWTLLSCTGRDWETFVCVQAVLHYFAATDVRSVIDNVWGRGRKGCCTRKL